MTSKARFTQADLTRAIVGARRAGLDVAGVSIKPDGEIIVFDERVKKHWQPSDWDDLDGPEPEPEWRTNSHFYRKRAERERSAAVDAGKNPIPSKMDPIGVRDRPYSPRELAERWSCSAQHIRTLVRRGRIAAFRHGKDIRIAAGEVDRIEREGTE